MPHLDSVAGMGHLESFTVACGMTGPLVLRATHRGTGATQTHEFRRPFLFIGRTPTTGLRLDDPSVSTCHAYLQVVGGVPHCVDVGSRTGVVWDDGTRGRGRLLPGRTLQIGKFDLVIDRPGDDPAPPAPEPDGGPPPVLEVRSAAGPGGYYPLDRPVTLVGRHPDCDRQVVDDAIAYFQCALVATPDGVWCVDILSPAGTRLSGRRVRLAPVPDGGLIELGGVTLVVRTGPRDLRPATPDGVAAADPLAAVPRMVAEALAPLREALDQSRQESAALARAVAALQSEHAAATGEQARQLRELAEEVAVLRADRRSERATLETPPARRDTPVEAARVLAVSAGLSEATPPPADPGPPVRPAWERPADAGADQAERRSAQIEMGNGILTSVLADRTTRLGPDHPDTLATMNDLAVGYGRAGQWDRALPLLEKVLELRRAKFGPDHPHTLATTGSLAAAYLASQHGDRALPLLDTYVPGMRIRLGADTPRFAGLLATVALDLLAARQLAAAEPYLREAVPVLERHQPDAWITFQALSMLGGSLLGRQRYADAEPVLLAGYGWLKRREATIPPAERARLPEAVDWLVALYAAIGNHPEAARWRTERANYPAGLLPPPGAKPMA